MLAASITLLPSPKSISPLPSLNSPPEISSPIPMKSSLRGPPWLRRDTASKRSALFLLPISLAVVLLVLFLNFPEHLQSIPDQLLNHLNISSDVAPRQTDLRILVGILTMVHRYEVRQLQRLVNSFRPPPANALVDVRFVVCRVTHDEDKELVGMEILRYGDMMILDCKENGNSGKTYTFFSTIARVFEGVGRSKYDYVLKTDDDTYIRYPELVESLLPLPREDLYYGYMVPPGRNHEGDPLFMKGMGYVLSWDIVEWIAQSEFAKNNSMGPEDKLVGLWLQHGGKGVNMYDTKPSLEQVLEWRGGGDRILDDKATQYDLPWPPLRFMPRTVSVHRVKDRAKWAQVLRYFNVTVGMLTFQ